MFSLFSSVPFAHHVIYLYNKVRQPWKTQKYAAQVMHDLYFNAPAGLCGNEDCGQMSAWYVFSAMGFYPVNPVSGEYEIGTPLFPEIQMHLDNGKTFTVLAPGVSRENIYIQSVKVNGQPYDKSYITHRQIMDARTHAQRTSGDGREYKGFFASMNWTGVAQCDIEMANAYKRPFYEYTTVGFYPA